MGEALDHTRAEPTPDSPPKAPRRRRRRRWPAVAAVIVALIVVGVAWLIGGRPGERRLERWVGDQMMAIVNGYLNPELTFDQFVYTYPLTVEILGAKLVADAPEMPGGEIAVIEADRLLITLGRVPSVGEPIEIKEVRLDRPVLRAVTDAPRSGRFYGYSNLLKADADAEPEPDADEPEGPPVKLSDVFRLRRVEINDGELHYDDRRDDAGAMRLDGLTTELTLTDPRDGWHTIDLGFGRRPLMEGELAGRLSLDDLKLDMERLHVAGRVGRAYDAALPPVVQSILRRYGATGEFESTLAGLLDLADPMGSDLTLQASLADGFLKRGRYRLPVDRFSLAATLKGRRLDVDPLAIEALGGRVEGGAGLSLDGDRMMSALIRVRDMHLEQTLEGTRGEGDEPLPYAGRVNGQVNLQGPIERLTTEAAGDGRFDLADGRLVKVPLLSAIRSASKTVLTLGQAKKYDDEAKLVFNFAGDRIEFTEIAAETGVIALRGKGNVRFDGELELRFNGGPLEKAQNMLGPIGDLMGAVTDKLAGYHVTGTLAEPKVNVKLLSNAPKPDAPTPEADPDGRPKPAVASPEPTVDPPRPRGPRR